MRNWGRGGELMVEEKLAILRELHRKLGLLLDDPQFGLISWTLELDRVVSELRKEV
jgi:hypothetical protein